MDIIKKFQEIDIDGALNVVGDLYFLHVFDNRRYWLYVKSYDMIFKCDNYDSIYDAFIYCKNIFLNCIDEYMDYGGQGDPAAY